MVTLYRIERLCMGPNGERWETDTMYRYFTTEKGCKEVVRGLKTSQPKVRRRVAPYEATNV